MVNKFICPLPWISLSIAPNSIPRVCCHQNGTLNDNRVKAFKDLIKLEYNKVIQEKMLQGEVPSECAECFRLEESGCISPRSYYLDKFKINNDEALRCVKYLDITIDNRCNLECIMCSPHFSNRLNQFFNKHLKVDNIDLWELSYSLADFDLILPSLQMLKITGGEVFFSPSAIRFLEYVINSGHSTHIDLRLFTNLSIVPKNLEDILNSFKSVEFIISVDSVEENYEFIRYPAKWSTLDSNILKILNLNLPNTSIFLHSVLMASNWIYISELIRYFYKIGLNKYTPLPIFGEIENPIYLHPMVLPPNEFDLGVNKIIDCLQEFFPNDQFSESKVENFLKLIEKIKIRDCKSYYIEYKAYLNKVKKYREIKK